jgi:hypothetical protein
MSSIPLLIIFLPILQTKYIWLKFFQVNNYSKNLLAREERKPYVVQIWKQIATPFLESWHAIKIKVNGEKSLHWLVLFWYQKQKKNPYNEIQLATLKIGSESMDEDIISSISIPITSVLPHVHWKFFCSDYLVLVLVLICDHSKVWRHHHRTLFFATVSTATSFLML